ncbi:MAG TPA: MFS transporter [Stellaceae bacterium]|nr:MFS transporter [Stellaceae bacterium]
MPDTVLLTSLSPARRRIAFYVLLAGSIMPPLNVFIVTIALPEIRATLNATASETGLIVSGYASAYAVCLITGGRLGDLFGRRFIFLVGMAGFTVTSFFAGIAPNATLLVISRVFQGATAALMAPSVLAALRSLFSEQEVPWALNVYGIGIGVAVAGGQFLGGILVAANLWGLGWRSAFLINVPAGLLLLLAAPLLVPESGGQDKPRLDLIGVVLLTTALGSLVFALSVGRDQHWAPWVLALIALSPVLVIAFFAYERALTRRHGMPILDAALLTVRRFRRGLLVALLFFFTSPFYLFFSIYLQAGVGEGALAAGLAVLPYGVANFLAPMLATRAPAAWRRYLFGVGMAVEILGYASVGLCGATQTGGAVLFAVLFIGGFGQGIAMPEMIHTILADVPHQYTGLAAGIMNSTLQIGSAVSVAGASGLFFTVLGDGAGAADYGYAFATVMATVVAALTLSMLLGLWNERVR